MSYFVVVMTCRYEGIQHLYTTLYTDRGSAEAFAQKCAEQRIADCIAGTESIIAYHQAKMNEPGEDRSSHELSLEMERKILEEWRSGTRDTSISFVVEELELSSTQAL